MVTFKEIADFKTFAGHPFSVITNGVESFGFFVALECFIRAIPGNFLTMGDCIIGIRMHKKVADAIASKSGIIEFENSEYDWLKAKFKLGGTMVFGMTAKDVFDVIEKAEEVESKKTGGKEKKK